MDTDAIRFEKFGLRFIGCGNYCGYCLKENFRLEKKGADNGQL